MVLDSEIPINLINNNIILPFTGKIVLSTSRLAILRLGGPREQYT